MLRYRLLKHTCSSPPPPATAHRVTYNEFRRRSGTEAFPTHTRRPASNDTRTREDRMPGYQVKFETVTVGGNDYRIRSLLDRNQYDDADGEAERRGFPPASWPLFGQLWPSARVLALIMDQHALDGQRILEIGAGLALASLVVHRREGNITVSDLHPLSRGFLDETLRLNALGPLEHHAGNWGGPNAGLGEFDLIIGSDVLYERAHPALLAAFISRHSAAEVNVIIIDPDRETGQGFVARWTCSAMRAASDGPRARWRTVHRTRAVCFASGEARASPRRDHSPLDRRRRLARDVVERRG